MSLDLKALAAEAAKMTPEEKAALAQIFGAGVAPAADGKVPDVDPAVVADVVVDLRKFYPRLPDERLQQMAVSNIIERMKNKRTAKPARAERVYFFLQTGRVDVQEITASKEDSNVLKITGYALPDRVIAVDEKTAARLFYKQRGRYGYVCRGDGSHWAKARQDGLNVQEAYAVEFEAAKAAQDRTPPPSREKTFLAGTRIASLERGRQIPWADGLQQGKTGIGN